MQPTSTQSFSRPVTKIGEHLQDALIHLENVPNITDNEKEQISDLLNKAFEIVSAVRS